MVADGVPPTSRYSTRWELSNLKKSRKSAGSQIVAIGDPAAQFESGPPLLRRAGPPVIPIRRRQEEQEQEQEQEQEWGLRAAFGTSTPIIWDYGFLLTATDGAVGGGGGADRFRIKIWERARGTVVYDNRRGSSDDLDGANPQALGGGSIVIHRTR